MALTEEDSMKIKVTFDDGGYVSGWCMVGDNGGEEYDPPEDFDAFLDNCFSFRLEDGNLLILVILSAEIYILYCQ